MYALRERRVHVTQEDFEMAVAKVQPLTLPQLLGDCVPRIHDLILFFSRSCRRIVRKTCPLRNCGSEFSCLAWTPQIKLCGVSPVRTPLRSNDQVWAPPINKRIYLGSSKPARSGTCQTLDPPTLPSTPRTAGIPPDTSCPSPFAHPPSPLQEVSPPQPAGVLGDDGGWSRLHRLKKENEEAPNRAP